MSLNFGKGVGGAKGSDVTPHKPAQGAQKKKDIDKDGPSVFGSLHSYSQAAQLEDYIQNNMEDTWKGADADKDGYLSKDELCSQAQKIMKEMYSDLYDSDDNLTADGASMLSSFMDNDKLDSMDEDKNGKLDKGEFEAYYKNTLFEGPILSHSAESDESELIGQDKKSESNNKEID